MQNFSALQKRMKPGLIRDMSVFLKNHVSFTKKCVRNALLFKLLL